MKLFNSRKGMGGGLIGIFASVIGLSIVLLIVGIFQAYSADIVTDVQADFVTNTANCNATSKTACGYAYNITQDNLEATDNLASKQTTLTNIGIAVIIIAMLLLVATIVGIKIA